MFNECIKCGGTGIIHVNECTQVHCPDCSMPRHTCTKCKGRGITGFTEFNARILCTSCGGIGVVRVSGTSIHHPCPDCAAPVPTTELKDWVYDINQKLMNRISEVLTAVRDLKNALAPQNISASTPNEEKTDWARVAEQRAVDLVTLEAELRYWQRDVGDKNKTIENLKYQVQNLTLENTILRGHNKS